jgi:uncharacterized membrane protein
MPRRRGVRRTWLATLIGVVLGQGIARADDKQQCLALGAALYIRLDALGAARILRKTCAPHCEQSQVDDIENRYIIGGVTAAVGGAALVAGVVLLLTHGRGTKVATSLVLTGAPLSRGPIAAAGVRF